MYSFPFAFWGERHIISIQMTQVGVRIGECIIKLTFKFYKRGIILNPLSFNLFFLSGIHAIQIYITIIIFKAFEVDFVFPCNIYIFRPNKYSSKPESNPKSPIYDYILGSMNVYELCLALMEFYILLK